MILPALADSTPNVNDVDILRVVVSNGDGIRDGGNEDVAWWGGGNDAAAAVVVWQHWWWLWCCDGSGYAKVLRLWCGTAGDSHVVALDVVVVLVAW
ncbi:hypothetical protein BVC80_1835g716 [Macleaya cordata]|uniref:Uncharacterized protein n=1 Tax=Macleaya cordata TaxID=56857 RepID=A0A200R6C6_MACCD|nr:hypothetical protein BVC80_1835g716 [Macleaya cordata]